MAIHGRSGRLYIDTTADGSGSAVPVACLNSWSISASTDKVDVTCFGDTNKAFVAGLPDVQGDYAGNYDTDGGNDAMWDVAIDEASRKFYLYPTTDDATHYWYGTGFFDFTSSGRVDGAVELSGSWAAAGAVTYVNP